MHLIPSVITSNNPNIKGEKKVFSLFSEVSFSKDSYLMHSVNLPEHLYKEWGEIDFLLVSREGILVLEVKGGRVERRAGIWIHTDTYNVEHRKSEGPNDQAKSAMYSLKKKLRVKLDNINFNKVVFGWGIIFPDIPWEKDNLEIPGELICDKSSMSNSKIFQNAIGGMFEYWTDNKKSKQINNLSPHQIKSIADSIRPNLDLVETLKSKVDHISSERVSMTTAQYELIDGIKNKRILCTGGAGTGKTFLAIEVAKREALSNKKILFVCKSEIFSEFLKLQLKNVSVVVTAIQETPKLAEKKAKFDLLIVDEGQDLLNMEDLELLDALLIDGLENGSWKWFMDVNNQSGVESKLDEDALDFLKSTHPVDRHLPFNCRNTLEIVKQTMLITGKDIGEPKLKGHGISVDYVHIESSLDANEKLQGLLSRWKEEVNKLNNIVILSPVSFEDSIVSKLAPKWINQIQILDVKNIINQEENKIIFATIRQFKGLEKAFVCIVDADKLVGESELESNFYVGMTRSISVLSIQVNDILNEYLDEQRANNIDSLITGSLR
mgnify:FL=1